MPDTVVLFIIFLLFCCDLVELSPCICHVRQMDGGVSETQYTQAVSMDMNMGTWNLPFIFS
jgi:hypothetical protein